MAFWFGVATAVPLIVGSAVGLRWQLPTPVLAVLMAFGAGTLTAAASEELFGPAFRSEGVVLAGLALMAGAGVAIVGMVLVPLLSGLFTT